MIRAAQMLRGERLVFCTIYQYIIIGKRYYAPPQIRPCGCAA